jgi:hypothetical protein
LFSDTDYGAFWTLLWQLQVAEWVTRKGLQARWQNPGPDLRVEVGGQPIFLECYSSAGVYPGVLFLEELLAHVHPHLVVSYHPHLNLSGNPLSLEIILEGCAKELDRSLAGAVKRVADGPWPDLLYSSPQGGAVQVRLEGSNEERYNSDLDRFPGSDPETHFAHILGKAFEAKSGKNGLQTFRPNVVAVNLATQEEFQAVTHILRDREAPSEFPLPKDLDGIIWSITGINEKLTIDPARCVWRAPTHPLRAIVEGGL